jgi:NitT/TauT family transport system substrate-binding protein
MGASPVRFAAALVALLLISSLAPARGDTLEHVRVGTTFTQSDAPIFIAIAKGYFSEAGIDADLIPFDTAANMIAPLGTGQIDVGSGAPTAGLFNAVRRGIDVKFVANESTSAPGYGVISLLVRRALVTSGRVKSFADLRGLTFAEVGQGTAAYVTMSAALRRGGLTPRDVREVFLAFPDQVIAFARGSIDAATTIEPFATQAIQSEVAVKFSSSDVLVPNGTNSAIFYGGPFSKTRGDVATKFMIAYIRGLRFYAGALRNGRLAGPNGPEVISILTKYTSIKDPNVFRAITPNAVDVNGRLNLPSLAEDLAVFQRGGLVPGDVTLDQAVDQSFVDAALRVLGPSRR